MTDFLLAKPAAPVFAPPSIVAERAGDKVLVDALIDRAFGPGRYAKTAERLREGGRPLPGLSFVCWRGRALVGCVRQWPILIGGAPTVFLGPFAVEADQRGQGLGAGLIRKACEAARDAGHAAIFLVGDAAYFQPLGFDPVPQGRLVMPGPVDPRRLLWRALTPGGTAALSGDVTRA